MNQLKQHIINKGIKMVAINDLLGFKESGGGRRSTGVYFREMLSGRVNMGNMSIDRWLEMSDYLELDVNEAYRMYRTEV